MQISDGTKPVMSLSYCRSNWWSLCQIFCPEQTLCQCELDVAALAAEEEASRYSNAGSHEEMSGNEVFDVEGVT